MNSMNVQRCCGLEWTRLALAFCIGIAGLGGLSGCANIEIGPNYNKPFKEQVLQPAKAAQSKVLLIEVRGILNDDPDKSWLGEAPSLLDSVLMQLKKAEADERIRTVLLKLNTPGGSVTASEILYHELQAFQQRTGKKLYVQMMDVAASGGYYLALAADHIQAHPTSVTGSVGVVSLTPDLSGTLEKIGVGVNVYKSGESKDMGSPFRSATAEDRRLFQSLVEEMAQRFHRRVAEHRGLSDAQMEEVKSARIYTGLAAHQAGLVDSLGYLSQAVEAACELGGLPPCEVVSYRYRTNDNAGLYSPSAQAPLPTGTQSVLQAPLLESTLQVRPGLYYLYLH